MSWHATVADNKGKVGDVVKKKREAAAGLFNNLMEKAKASSGFSEAPFTQKASGHGEDKKFVMAF